MALSYSVRLLDAATERAYESFWSKLSARDERILAYHHLAYRDVLSEALGPGVRPRYWVVVGASEEGAATEVLAALPLFVRDSEQGPTYCSLPFFGPNAGVLCDMGDPRAELFHELLVGAALADALAANAWSLVFYTPLEFQKHDWYLRQLGPETIVVDKFTQWMPIDAPSKWSAKIAYDIRRATRAGLERVTTPTQAHAEEFWQLYESNCDEYGIPRKPRRGFDACLNSMVPRGLGQFDVLVDRARDGRVVAGLLNLHSELTVSYYMPAYDSEYRSAQPMAMLIASAAEDAARSGRRFWNWEASASRESGVYRYKARWGARESPYNILVRPVRPLSEFREVGRDLIAAWFPFFFVMPFSIIDS